MSTIPEALLSAISRVSDHVTGLATLVGILVGVGFAVAGRSHAVTVVTSTARFPEMTLTEAVVSNHVGDWLFYQYPTVMTAVIVIIWGAVGAGYGLKR